MWKDMSSEQRKPYEDKAAEKKALRQKRLELMRVQRAEIIREFSLRHQNGHKGTCHYHEFFKEERDSLLCKYGTHPAHGVEKDIGQSSPEVSLCKMESANDDGEDATMTNDCHKKTSAIYASTSSLSTAHGFNEDKVLAIPAKSHRRKTALKNSLPGIELSSEKASEVIGCEEQTLTSGRQLRRRKSNANATRPTGNRSKKRCFVVQPHLKSLRLT